MSLADGLRGELRVDTLKKTSAPEDCRAITCDSSVGRAAVRLCLLEERKTVIVGDALGFLLGQHKQLAAARSREGLSIVEQDDGLVVIGKVHIAPVRAALSVRF
jgi:hypothetical protein